MFSESTFVTTESIGGQEGKEEKIYTYRVNSEDKHLTNSTKTTMVVTAEPLNNQD